MWQPKRITTVLGVSANSASAEDTRIKIDAKFCLFSNRQEFQQCKIVEQDLDADSGTLFLMNYEGVILTVKAVIVSHMTSDEVESNVSSCSVLWSKHVLRSLSTKPNELEVIVAELHLALAGEKQKSST